MHSIRIITLTILSTVAVSYAEITGAYSVASINKLNEKKVSYGVFHPSGSLYKGDLSKGYGHGYGYGATSSINSNLYSHNSIPVHHHVSSFPSISHGDDSISSFHGNLGGSYSSLDLGHHSFNQGHEFSSIHSLPDVSHVSTLPHLEDHSSYSYSTLGDHGASSHVHFNGYGHGSHPVDYGYSTLGHSLGGYYGGDLGHSNLEGYDYGGSYGSYGSYGLGPSGLGGHIYGHTF